MPIYEYQCAKCGFRFETLQKMGAEERILCPRCGSPDPRRIISAFASLGGGSEFPRSGGGCLPSGGG